MTCWFARLILRLMGASSTTSYDVIQPSSGVGCEPNRTLRQEARLIEKSWED